VENVEGERCGAVARRSAAGAAGFELEAKRFGGGAGGFGLEARGFGLKP
jgi:hypothetical protein